MLSAGNTTAVQREQTNGGRMPIPFVGAKPTPNDHDGDEVKKPAPKSMKLAYKPKGKPVPPKGGR